jgi:hypothetical protein
VCEAPITERMNGRSLTRTPSTSRWISGAYRGPVRVLFALGGVFLVVGVIWLGQGVGLIGGSFMTGEAVWAVIGGICMVVGALLVRTGFRWRQTAPFDEDG